MAERMHSDHWRASRVLFWLVAVAASLIFVAWRFLMTAEPEQPSQPVLASADAQPQTNPTTAFEPTDWPIGPIALLYVGVLLLLVICAFVLIAAYPDALSKANLEPRVVPPAPRLQTDGEADLRRFRADEDRRLNSYGWIDREKGIVHIPIEQAMKRLVQTGAPGFPKGSQ